MTEVAKLPSGPEMAAQVLEEAGKPAHVKVIAKRVLALDGKRPKAKRAYQGKTPEQTISAQLTVSHNAGGRFERLAPGVFALRAWTAAQKRKAPELPEGFKLRQPGSGGSRQSEALPPGSTVLREAKSAAEAEAERKVREAANGSRASSSKASSARKGGGASKGGRKAKASKASKAAASSAGSRKRQATKRS
jgi:hypothetical protein